MAEKSANLHVDRFIEQLGRLAESENLPRTAGRMMGLLILSGRPLDIDGIATRLHVSRASVSTNSRLLQTLGIAQLVRQPENRRDYLQISGDPCSSLLALGLLRMQSMQLAIREMRLALKGVELRISRSRLEGMERLYETAIERVRTVLPPGLRTNLGPPLSPAVDVVPRGETPPRVRNARLKTAVRHR